MWAGRAALIELLFVAATTSACGGADSAREAGAGGSAGSGDRGGAGGAGGADPWGPRARLPKVSSTPCAPAGPSSCGGCCQYVICYSPAAGPCLQPTQENQVAILAGADCAVRPPTYVCEEIAGPFMPVIPAPPSPLVCDRIRAGERGECCYVASFQRCAGRPLVVDGQARVASLAWRADWSLDGDETAVRLLACQRTT